MEKRRKLVKSCPHSIHGSISGKKSSGSRIHECVFKKKYLFNDGEGAKKVDGGAALIGVANELGVELLVAGKADATGLFVVILKNCHRLLCREIQIFPEKASKYVQF